MVAKGAGQKPTAFLKKHETEYPLVLPEKDVQAVLQCTTCFTEVSDELHRLAAGSTIGYRLFSFAVKQVLGEQVQEKIKTAIAVNLDKANLVISVEDILKTKRQAISTIDELPNIASLQDRRDFKFRYRGFPVPGKCTCIGDQVDICIWSFLNGLAVNRGLLSPLLGEDDLVAGAVEFSGEAAVEYKDKNTVEEAILTDVEAGRALMNNMAAVGKVKDATQLQATMRANEKKLMGLDKMWKVSKFFLLALIGTGGEEVLMNMMRAALPSPVKMMDLQDSCGRVQGLLTGPVFKFAGKPVQGLMTIAGSLVTKLGSGETPDIPKNSHAFVKEVFGKLGWFICHEIKDDSAGEDETRSLHGTEAARMKLKAMVGMKGTGKGKDDGMKALLEELASFDWLLPSDEKAQFDQMVVDLTGTPDEPKGKAGAKQGSLASSSTSGQPPLKKKKTGKAALSADDCADFEATSLMFK